MMKAVLVALALAANVADAAWTDQPIKIVVPYAAGGYPDLVARLAQQGLSQRAGGTFVVENKPGASGNIGLTQVAKAKPDGTTFGVVVAANLTTNTILYSKLPYRLNELSFVAKVTSTASVLAVNPASGVTTVQELLALLKREPGKHNYASVGNGTFSHMLGESLGVLTDTKVTGITYGGAPDTVSALLRGDVTVALLPASTTVPLARAGKVKALAVTSGSRLSSAPDLPTLREAGIDFVGDAWIGFVTPVGTPKAVIDAFRDDLAWTFEQPAARATLAQQYVDVRFVGSRVFEEEVKEETARFKPLIERMNIKLD